MIELFALTVRATIWMIVGTIWLTILMCRVGVYMIVGTIELIAALSRRRSQ